MLHSLYNWLLRLAERRGALWTLAGVSFTESFVFPLPPDLLLVPMVLARRDRAWVIATVCTLASVIGGLIGYGIGVFLFEQIGRSILSLYNYDDPFRIFQATYEQWGIWIVIAGGLTPLPYKIVTIISGVVELNLVLFLFASLASRGLRFFLLAGLLWYFGPWIKRFIETYLSWLVTGLLILALIGFMIVL